VITVGVYDFAPLVFIDKNSKPGGLFIDVLEYVARREGWRIEYVPGTWDQSLQRIEKGEIDLIACIGYSKDRASRLDFTKDFLFLDWGRVYEKIETDLESVFDLEGKKVAVLKGSIYTTGFRALLEQFEVRSEIVEKDNYRQVFQAIEVGEVDAGINGRVAGMLLGPEYKIKPTEILFSPVKIGFGTPKGKSAEILKTLDTWITRLKADKNSVYYRRLNYWTEFYTKRTLVSPWLLRSLVVAAVLCLVSTGFVFLLRRQVRARTSELSMAYKTISDSEEKFSTAFRFAPIPMSITSMDDGRFVDVNDAFLSTYGYTRDDVFGKTAVELGLWKDEKERSTVLEQIEAHGSATNLELSFSTKEGSPRHGLFSAVTIHLRGMPVLLISFNDITGRKRAEEALSQVKHDWEDTFDSIEDMITIHDKDFNIIHCNKSAGRILGLPNLLPPNGAKCYRYYHGKDFPPEACPSCRCLQTEEPAVSEIFEPHLNMFVEIRAIPRFDGNGQLTGLIHIVRDITNRKKSEEDKARLEQQLLQAQKMEAVGTLAGGVAHDFNNVLQVVLGYSELILEDEELPRRYKADLLRINESAARGADLVQRLLTFSRKTEINPLPTNLNRRINEMRKMLERTIPKMIDIQLILAADLAPVDADPTQLDQILMNLALNARDAMPDGGKLVIETANIILDAEYSRNHLGTRSGQHVLLTVSDTGTGMGKDTLEHIFEPFFTTKEIGKGTGLGLAMVYGIVQQHGGHIWCYSEPGKGTTFKIYLPALVSGEDIEQTRLGPMPRGGSETILLVDDEEDIRDLGSRILKKAGYKVIAVSNGKQALEVYQRRGNEIALVMLDLIMPEMGGKQCLEGLLSLNSSVKVVVASGYSGDGPTKDVFAAGAKGFVNKPYDVRKVLEVVRRVLDAEYVTES